MNIAENISFNIYYLKTNLKLSYEALGLDVGMCSKKIKRFVHKKQSPKINEIEVIANYFGLTPIDFLSKKVA